MTRRIGRDVSILSVGGTSVLALYQECTLTVFTEEIDVSATKDTWQSIRPGRSRYTLECRKLIDGSPVFVDQAAARAQLPWSANIDGVIRNGSGYIIEVATVAGPAEVPERCVLLGDGAIL